MKHGLLLIAALALAPSFVFADGPERPASVLVLDASGSMWRRIGERTKIEIAHEAVDTLLAGWNAGTDLGLMVYGHRRKGDCADIELLQPIGPLDADAFRAQVAGLQPTGMTPIAVSVRQAAEALRYTEQRATVILVSDGEETCNADPCALGAELEAQGVDFTAHVVGFDVEANPAAREQLQCLAQATGGRYFDARDAGELDAALASVAEQPAETAPPAPPPRECGEYVGGEAFMDGMATWPTGGTSTAKPDFEPQQFESVELAADATPRECQSLCEAETGCGAWGFEPVGSNFRTLPVCFRWDAGVALSPPREGHPGSAMGIRPGVRSIQIKDGEPCDDVDG